VGSGLAHLQGKASWSATIVSDVLFKCNDSGWSFRCFTTIRVTCLFVADGGRQNFGPVMLSFANGRRSPAT